MRIFLALTAIAGLLASGIGCVASPDGAESESTAQAGEALAREGLPRPSTRPSGCVETVILYRRQALGPGDVLVRRPRLRSDRLPRRQALGRGGVRVRMRRYRRLHPRQALGSAHVPLREAGGVDACRERLTSPGLNLTPDRRAGGEVPSRLRQRRRRTSAGLAARRKHPRRARRVRWGARTRTSTPGRGSSRRRRGRRRPRRSS